MNFEPLKPLFLEVHAAALAVAPGLPGLRPLAVPLERGWGAEEGARAPAPAPAHPLSLTLLEAKLQVRPGTAWQWRCCCPPARNAPEGSGAAALLAPASPRRSSIVGLSEEWQQASLSKHSMVPQFVRSSALLLGLQWVCWAVALRALGRPTAQHSCRHNSCCTPGSSSTCREGMHITTCCRIAGIYAADTAMTASRSHTATCASLHLQIP